MSANFGLNIASFDELVEMDYSDWFRVQMTMVYDDPNSPSIQIAQVLLIRLFSV